MTQMPTHDHDRFCTNCGTDNLETRFVERAVEVKHEGKAYNVVVRDARVQVCTHCGEEFVDTEYGRQIYAALRDQLGFMQPEEIYRLRTRLGLKQAEVSEATGIAVETLSRYENGRTVQTRAYDNLLRFYFDKVLREKTQQEAEAFVTDPAFGMAA